MTPRRRPRFRTDVTWAAALAAALSAAAVVAGCGVPLEGRAQATPASDLPYDLESSGATTTAAEETGQAATIFLVRREQLVTSSRAVSDPGDLTALVASLAGPLSADEVGAGLRRALTDPGMVGSLTRTGRLVTVELTRTFDQLASREQVLALGQIVFTLTERDEVDQVRFSRDGEPLTVPTGSGTLVDTPVTRYDYRSLRGG